jgi:hypothetical protein
MVMVIGKHPMIELCSEMRPFGNKTFRHADGVTGVALGAKIKTYDADIYGSAAGSTNEKRQRLCQAPLCLRPFGNLNPLTP